MKKKQNNIRKNATIKNLENCQSKKFFKTENSAKRACEMQNLMQLESEISYYKCSYCKGWHLTSRTY